MRIRATVIALVALLVVLGVAPATWAATPKTTVWYWTEADMAAALRVDYAYDPSVAIPGDPWHFELATVICVGNGSYLTKGAERAYTRFSCTMTYKATDPSIADYVDTSGARPTGAASHIESDLRADEPPTAPAHVPGRALMGYPTWGPILHDRAAGWLRRPGSLLLLGRDGVLADSPGITRIRWSAWGGARAVGVGRTRTKTYDPWSRVRLVADQPRPCGDTTVYTRVLATFTSTDHGVRRVSHGTWPMPCRARLR